MIDQWYDRAYREGRDELNASVIRLFAYLARSIRPRQSRPAGEPACMSRPSPSSPPPPR